MRWLLLVLFMVATVVQADGPTTTAPVERPTVKYNLLEGAIEYTLPNDWTPSPNNDSKETAVFTTAGNKAFMAVIVQKEGLPMNDQLAIALLKSTREQRKKSGVKVIKEAKIQKDSRFEARLYEEYEDQGRKYAQLLLFRQRGKRPVSLKVTLMDIPEAYQKELFKDGEDALVSLKWVKAK